MTVSMLNPSDIFLKQTLELSFNVSRNSVLASMELSHGKMGVSSMSKDTMTIRKSPRILNGTIPRSMISLLPENNFFTRLLIIFHHLMTCHETTLVLEM